MYVDDILLTSNDKSELTKVKVELKREFEMKDLGAASKILGIETKRDRNKKYLFLFQDLYLMKVLEKVGMFGAKPVTLPISQQFKLSNDQAPSSEGGKKIMAKIPYANAVGSLMYVIVCT